MLQQIILGQAIIHRNSKFKSQVTEGLHLLIADNNILKTYIWMNPNDFRIEKMTLEDRPNNRKVEVTFSDYKTLEGGPFSHQRHISFEGSKKIDIDLNFVKISFQKIRSFPFTISSKYVRVE